MGLIHSLVAYHGGHLTGLQSDQRDFSPYVAHFTSFSAMRPLRSVVKSGQNAGAAAQLLSAADLESWEVVQKIFASQTLMARSPSEHDALPPCVCMSECTLPGVISHCERYGRFGFAFRKSDIFAMGGRPCLYVAPDEYGVLAVQGRGKSPETPQGRLYALSNVYVPPHGPNKVQDYTHEREWRVFSSVDLRVIPLAVVIAPSRFAPEISKLARGAPVVPIDTLFDWGA